MLLLCCCCCYCCLLTFPLLPLLLPVCLSSSSTMSTLVAGVEGGATKSTLVLFDASSMKELASAEGPSTNHHQLGMEETCRRLHGMLKEAMDKSGSKAKLESLGLSLSGCETKETNIQLADTYKKMFPGKKDK